MRLGPLLEVERQLTQAINPESPIYASSGRFSFDADTRLREGRLSSKPSKELVVRAGSNWMNKVDGGVTASPGNHPDEDDLLGREEADGLPGKPSTAITSGLGKPIFRGLSSRFLGTEKREEEKDDATAGPAVVLEACCEDIVSLWADPVVRDILKKRGLDMQSYPGL